MNTEILNNVDFEILTPSGYQPFVGMRKLIKDTHLEIKLSNNKTIKCSETHPFMFNRNKLHANELEIGDKIDSEEDDSVIVISIEHIDEPIELYDIVEVNNGNVFTVDGIISHNCDFSTSGNQVVNFNILTLQKDNYVIDPIEKRGSGDEYWIWEEANYSKDYIVMADCARGDGSDYSAAHIFGLEDMSQCAEYKRKLSPKDYGNQLVAMATEYNNALLVIENNNIGWATIQQVIDRSYDNLYYSSENLNVVDVAKNFNNKFNAKDKRSVPGIAMSSANRPLMVSKLETYFNENSLIIRSLRLYDELCVFIWDGHKAQAMSGYNDDLVTSLMLGLWVRDQAIKLAGNKQTISKAMLGGIRRVDSTVPSSNNHSYYGGEDANRTWKMNNGITDESLKWLIQK